MARFDLSKGQKFDLTKENSGLNAIEVKLAWKGPDIDASTFLLGEEGIIMKDADFVYFKSNSREATLSEYIEKINKDGRWSDDTPERKRGNKKTWLEDTRPISHDGSILGSIDDLGGEEDSSEESDETINVTLDEVSEEIKEIVFVVTVYNDPKTPLEEHITFKDIVNPYLSIINLDTDEEILRYQIDEKFNSETAVEVARLYKSGNEWEVEAVGDGFEGSLGYFVELYT